MKKRRLLPVLILSVCALTGLAIGFLAGAVHRARTQPEEPALERAAVTCGDWSLSCTELGFYYWSEYFYYINTDASPQPDHALPLEQQEYAAGETWRDYFLAQAIEKVESTMTLVFAGRAAGYALDGSYLDDYAQVRTRFTEYAAAAGYVTDSGAGDLGAYLRASYGPYADEERFFAYLENAYYAAGYAQALRDAYDPDETEVKAYYDAHCADYDADWDEPEPVTLRVITLTGADAAARAQTLYEQWRAAGGSEEGFSQLAQEYSRDAQAERGGLYEDLAWPDATGALQDWCFAPGRAALDSAVLETEDGSALVLFLSRAEHGRAYEQCLADLRYEHYRNQYEALAAEYPFTVSADQIVLAVPEGLYDESETE